MSRLDSVIRRLQAQRACLDAAAVLVAGIPGPVLEVGLGNGRTYDHLRQILPDRPIFAFDRHVAAHPSSIPAPAFLILGDFRDTLGTAAARIGAKAALIHADIGTGDEVATRALADAITPGLVALLAEGGVIISDQEMSDPSLEPLSLPDGVKPGRYHVRRKRAA